MGIVNNEWIDRLIMGEWENPEFRKGYIEATEELYRETGIDTFHEIDELDAKLESKRMAKTGEAIK